MRNVTVAVTQFAPGWDLPANLDRAEALVRRAAGEGAQVILLQELFATPYFCITEEPRHLALAAPMEGHPVVARFAALARELGVVLPVSVFERAGEAHFNSVAMVDRDGSILGTYRKSHIPQGPGYEEKFYFTPGDTGFRVWDTAFGRIVGPESLAVLDRITSVSVDENQRPRQPIRVRSITMVAPRSIARAGQ